MSLDQDLESPGPITISYTVYGFVIPQRIEGDGADEGFKNDM